MKRLCVILLTSANLFGQYLLKPPIQNNTSTGTTQFKLVSLDSAGLAIITPTSATSGAIGVAYGGAGTVGQVVPVFSGFIPLVADGATTSGHFIQISGSAAGNGHDAGASCPSSGQTIGVWQQTIGSAGTALAWIDLTICPTATASGSGTVNSGTANQTGYYAGAGTTISGVGPGTAGQLYKSAGTGSAPSFVDLPDTKFIPAANCNNTTGANGWSIGSGGTVSCRAGTNNLGGYIQISDTSSTFAQFAVVIPEDWDSATNPYIRFFLASTDTTSGHTIIPSIQVSCGKGDGTTTEDIAFNAAHSASTVTTNTTNHQFWSTSNVQMNSTDVTGCAAGSLMIVQVGRATDTSTNAQFYGAQITFPRQVIVQAN